MEKKIKKKIDIATAIKKMKAIEKSIAVLKDAGYSIYCQDTDKIILESPDLQRKNAEISRVEASRGVVGYGSIQYTFSELEKDYEIYL